MSLKGQIRRATKNAFKRTKSIQVVATYLKLGEEQYDTTTKEATRPILNKYTRNGFLTSFTTDEVLSGLVSPEDQRLTIERRLVDWECDPHDEIEIKGENWRIKRFKAEPSDSVAIFLLTKE